MVSGCLLRHAAIAASLCLVCVSSVAADNLVDFNRQIRPILSDHCFVCHGPDRSQSQTEYRLDIRESAFAEQDGHHAIVPGDPQASNLVKRITSGDADVVMPPPDSGRPLSKDQIELLTRWIAQGARWNEHWAFVPPQEAPVPKTSRVDWIRNPIDAFVLAGLEKAGLQPSPEASRATLIRRASLDLTGLPPSPEEVKAFVEDTSPNAWENALDHLLRSPRCGERMAMDWLDAARYADTSGYQNDGPRQMWRWRDWVIDAFNANMPFDQFTIEQIAGDLLENPTLQQRIATGFNRNHRGNAEGGIIPEEYQVEYVVDRVDTTFAVWLGLTMGCARCHDHKYDPLTQREYYQVFAFFNNLPESGRAIKEGNSPPWVKAPTAAEQQQLELLDRQIQSLTQQVTALEDTLKKLQREWETSQAATLSANVQASGSIGINKDGLNITGADWTSTDGLLHRFRFEDSLQDSVTGIAATAEAADLPFVEGKPGRAVQFQGNSAVAAAEAGNFGYFDKFSIAAWIRPDNPSGTIVSRMTPVEEGAGYYVHLHNGHLQVNLVKRWLDDSIRVESRDPLPMSEWQHVTVTYDGSRLAEGIRVYLNGRPVPMEVRLDRLNQTFAELKEPFRVGRGHSDFHGTIDEVQVYGRALTADEVSSIAPAETITEIVIIPEASRTAEQAHKLTAFYIDQQAPQETRDVIQQLVRLRRQRVAFEESISTVMVMQDMPTPRPTFVLHRGQYDQPRDPVTPGIPAVFPPLPADAKQNRLSFAKWLVSPDHPLTARVAVNRFWQQLFGAGLVRTPEDFGVQGEPPTHPELLDWLAVEFVRSGWNVRALQKMIMSSATYRQSSHVTPDLLRADPENRLLARGARHRLPAEVIRDQALYVSGLLKEQLGGPSVKPYQPDGLWKEIATDTAYEQSTGSDLYRRSLYIYWKRTVAPPTMVTLDATAREACIVRRSRTNTPLQALTLMNETAFVEAARVLAERVLAVPNLSAEERIGHAFLLATARQPREEERIILGRQLERARQTYSARPEAAAQLIRIGQSVPNSQLDAVELAALTTTASLILNLDEVINRE